MADSSLPELGESTNVQWNEQNSENYYVPSFLSSFSNDDDMKIKNDFNSMFPGLTANLSTPSLSTSNLLDSKLSSSSLFPSFSDANNSSDSVFGSFRNNNSNSIIGSNGNGSQGDVSAVAKQECQCGHIFLDMDDYLSHIAITGHQKVSSFSSQYSRGSLTADSLRNPEFQPTGISSVFSGTSTASSVDGSSFAGVGVGNSFSYNNSNNRRPPTSIPQGAPPGGPVRSFIAGIANGGPHAQRYDPSVERYGMNAPSMAPLDDMGYPIDNRYYDRYHEEPHMNHMRSVPQRQGRGGRVMNGNKNNYPPQHIHPDMNYREPMSGHYDYPVPPPPHDVYPPPPFFGPGLGQRLERGLGQGLPPNYYPHPPMNNKFNPNHGPYQGINNDHDKSIYIVSFGAIVKPDSLVGGCGWWISNENKTVVIHGSAPVQQAFPSQVRLEYEALLNGLKAAHLKHMKYLLIRSCSDMVLSMLRNEKFHMFQSIYSLVSDLDQAVQKLIPQFAHIELEWIHPDNNFYSQKLAKDSIANFYRRKESHLSKY